MWDILGFKSWLPVSASSYADQMDGLLLLVTFLITIGLVLSEGCLFYLMFRYRKKEGGKAKYITGTKKNQYIWLVMPMVLFMAFDAWIDIATARVWNDIKIERPPAEDTIKVIGSQWAWSFIHKGPDGKFNTDDDIEMSNELHVRLNTIVHLEMEATDTIHSFSVPVFRFKQDVIPGRRITGWFKATKAGEWDIQCTEMCGVGHGVMAARIHVDTEEEYKEFLDENL